MPFSSNTSFTSKEPITKCSPDNFASSKSTCEFISEDAKQERGNNESYAGDLLAGTVSGDVAREQDVRPGSGAGELGRDVDVATTGAADKRRDFFAEEGVELADDQ